MTFEGKPASVVAWVSFAEFVLSGSKVTVAVLLSKSTDVEVTPGTRSSAFLTTTGQVPQVIFSTAKRNAAKRADNRCQHAGPQLLGRGLHAASLHHVRQSPLSLCQESQQLTALIEVLTSLRSHGRAPRHSPIFGN